jgi:hypothetical protein
MNSNRVHGRIRALMKHIQAHGHIVIDSDEEDCQVITMTVCVPVHPESLCHAPPIGYNATQWSKCQTEKHGESGAASVWVSGWGLPSSTRSSRSDRCVARTDTGDATCVFGEREP